MISLATPETARLQSQIGAALSHIASLDFPDKWDGLIDVSVHFPCRGALGGSSSETMSGT